MSLKRVERELAAVGISVAAGCKPCTGHHVEEAQKAGATGEEIKAAVTSALVVRDGAAKVMRTHALGQLGEPTEAVELDEASKHERNKVLVSIGAAFAVSCTSSLRHWVLTARDIGIPEREIQTVLGLAVMVKNKADEHVVKLRKELAPSAEMA